MTEEKKQGRGPGNVIDFNKALNRMQARVAGKAPVTRNATPGNITREGRIDAKEFAAMGDSSRGRQEQTMLLFVKCTEFSAAINYIRDSADLALTMAAINAIRARRGFIGGILWPKVTLDEIRAEIEAMRSLRKEIVTEGRKAEEAKSVQPAKDGGAPAR